MINSNDSKSGTALSAVGAILSGYEPGYELIKGNNPNAVERFHVLSVRGIPRLLLPTAEPMMRMAMMSFLGGRRFTTLLPPLIKFGSWIGGPFSGVTSKVSLLSESGSPSQLRELLSSVLDRNDFQIAMRLSFGRPNAKMVAVAISDAGEVLCFAKFGSEAMTNDLVAHESAVLEKFEGTDMPFILPKRLYSGTWAGSHNVLITAPLALESLNSDASTAHQAADAFTAQTLGATSTLIDSAYWAEIAERINSLSDRGAENNDLLGSVEKISQVWGDTSFDFGASHGDWTRANLGMVDGRLAVFDWERCSELSPRGIDTAHFALCENSFSSIDKSRDIETTADSVRQYLTVAGQSPKKAELLIILAMLEMVIRFRSAQTAGLKSTDSKFGPALQASLQMWAV